MMRERTPAELQENVEAITIGIEKGFTSINARLDKFEQNFVRRDLYETRHQFLFDKLAAHERSMVLEIQRLEKAFQLETLRLEKSAAEDRRAVEEMKASYGKKMWALATGILFPLVVALLLLLFTSGALGG